MSADHGSAVGGVDPRGSRFGAAITTVVLAVVLVAGPDSPLGIVLVIFQAVMFAVGALLGPRRHPYAFVFRALVRPRLGPPGDLEDPAPPRFAQVVGLVFAVIAIVGVVAAWSGLFYAAVALAFAAALLNAAFGFCLGCEVYLLVRRGATR